MEVAPLFSSTARISGHEKEAQAPVQVRLFCWLRGKGSTPIVSTDDSGLPSGSEQVAARAICQYKTKADLAKICPPPVAQR